MSQDVTLCAWPLNINLRTGPLGNRELVPVASAVLRKFGPHTQQTVVLYTAKPRLFLGVPLAVHDNPDPKLWLGGLETSVQDWNIRWPTRQTACIILISEVFLRWTPCNIHTNVSYDTCDGEYGPTGVATVTSRFRRPRPFADSAYRTNHTYTGVYAGIDRGSVFTLLSFPASP